MSDAAAIAERGPDSAPRVAARIGAVRYGAYMVRRFGWFVQWTGLGRMLSRLRIDDASVERVRRSAEQGPIVYVLLRTSTLDHLALNAALVRRRLPLSVYADGAASFPWQPVYDAWRDVARRVRLWFSGGRMPNPVASGWLAATVAAGAPVVVHADVEPLPEPGRDPFEALLLAQARVERPISLLPVVVVWDRAPEQRGSPLRTFIEGSHEAPSWWRRLRSALFDRGFVQVGEPVRLPELIGRVEPDLRARALRLLVRRYLHRESRVIRGPRLLTPRVMRRVVLDDPPMRRLAHDEAIASGRQVDAVRADMERHLDHMSARLQWWTIRALDVVLRPLWTKVFRGVDVREQDLERIRTALRGGAAILVPSHKSHFDYLLLSWVLYDHRLTVPHVVAGENLALPVVSFFLRRAGAIFIQRRFGGDRLFPAVFARYLRELVHQGYPIEFFIEGGRTRTGKLLPPKLGVLSMVFDAAATRRTGQEVTLLPMSIAYERVAEQGSYARELAGTPKEPESLGQVVQATGLLRRRFGRAVLRVGAPIALGPVVDAPRWSDRPERARRAVVAEVGERVVAEIGRTVVVLPPSVVALALLSSPTRGVRHDDLVARVERFRGLLADAGAEESATFGRTSRVLSLTLDRFVAERLVAALTDASGGRVWSIDPERRISLDFYKNQVLHFLAPAGLATLAIRATPEPTFDADTLRGRFVQLLFLLRREFVFDPQKSASTLLDEGLASLVRFGALAADGRRHRVDDVRHIAEVYGLFRPFAEALLLVARRAGALALGRDAGQLAAALLAERDRAIADGDVTRPEALSLAILENTVRSFVDDRTLTADPRGRLTADTGRLDALAADLAPMVARRPTVETAHG